MSAKKSILISVLVFAFGFTPVVKEAKGISNPIFNESMDVQGGSWDGYKGYRGIDLLSGNWRANLRVGSNQAWIDPVYFPASSSTETSSSITSVLTNAASNPYGLPSGAITIDMNATMVNQTTNLGLRNCSYVVSEPWVMKQTYTITNTGTSTLNDIAFYQYYFPSPYGSYPTNSMPSHVDYTAGISDPIGYIYDITFYGEGDGNNWAYTGLSTNIPPTTHDVGHGGGYPDPPYYSPSPPVRPSADSNDVLRQVENDTLRGWASYDAPSGSDPNAVAGAFKWNMGSLSPGESCSVTFLESVSVAVPTPSSITIFKTDDVNDGDCVGPGDEITYTIDYNYPYEPNSPDINDVNIIDYLPDEVDFNWASGPNCVHPDSNTVIWHIGTLHPGDSGFVTLKVKVNNGCFRECGVITNFCEIKSGYLALNRAYENTPLLCCASNPRPTCGATAGLYVGEVPYINLRWCPGFYAADVNGHDVYLGTDYNEVSDMNTSGPDPNNVYKGRQTTTTYTASNLLLGQTYYWRIDEVNDTNVWKGTVWSFTVGKYLVIDDFESYDSNESLLTRWEIGNDYESCPFEYAAGQIGWESSADNGTMRYDYDNQHGSDLCGPCYFSEVRFDANGADWTGGDALPENDKARALAISYIGGPRNSSDNQNDPDYDRMYVAIEDTAGHLGNIILNSEPEGQRTNVWRQWNINLYDLNSPDVNLKAVKYLYLGFGVRCNTGYQGGTGTVIFDDIRLYQRRCVPEYGPAGDLTSDCRVDIHDVNMFAGQWLVGQTQVTPVEPPDVNLKLRYDFNEFTGKIVNDLSGNDYDGDVNVKIGAVDDSWWDPTGGYDGNGCLNVDYKLAFDYDAFVEANKVALNFVADKHAITFSIWVNADIYLLPGWPRLISVHQDADPCLSGESEVVEIECPVYTTTSPQARFIMGLDEVDSGSLQWSDFGGGWNHYAFVKDADANLMRIYHNGELIAETNNTAAPMFGPPIESFRIGRRDLGSEPWAGKIDDFRVYDYALSQEEVAWLAGFRDNPSYVPVPYKNKANLKTGSTPEIVDFGDFAVLAQQWLTEQLWP